MAVFLVFALPAHAERKNQYGAAIDFMGGMSNQVGTSSLRNQGFHPFYGLYPSVNLTSLGSHSSLDLDYTLGIDRYQLTKPITTTSHTFSAAFNAQLGARTRLRLSDSFNNAPDYSTVNVLKGYNLTPEGFQYIFEPELYERPSISNSARGEFEMDVGARSSLTFSGSGSIRRYHENPAAPRAYFNNQFRLEGSVAYARRSSERQTWRLTYNIRRNEYRDYDPSRTHSATIGMMRRLTPNTDLTLDAGPSYTEKRGETESYVSYDVSAQLTRKFGVNVFSAGYSHRPGDSTGLARSSDSHQGTLGFSRTFGRWTSFRLQASAFKQSRRDTDLYNYRGVQGSAALSRQLGRHWAVSAGASYNEYEQYDSRRFYISIGWRTATAATENSH